MVGPCWLSANIATKFGIPHGENVHMSALYASGCNVPPSAGVPTSGTLNLTKLAAASNLTYPLPLKFNFDARYSALSSNPHRLDEFASVARSNLAAKMSLPAQALTMTVTQDADDGLAATAVVQLPYNNTRKAAASNAVVSAAMSADPTALFGSNFASLYLDTAVMSTSIDVPMPVFSVPVAKPMGSVSLDSNNTAVYALADYFSDPSPLVYTLAQNPKSNVNVTSNASLLVNGASRGTSYTVLVRGTNAFGASATSALDVKEAATGVSFSALAPPTVTAPLGSIALSSNIATYSLSNYFADTPSAQPLKYTLTANPVRSAEFLQGVLAVTGNNRGSNYDVTVACTNVYGKSVSNSLHVAEAAPPAPTVIAPLGSLTLGTNTAAYTLADHFYDSTGNGLSYSVVRNPRGNAAVTSGGLLRIVGRGRGVSYTVVVAAKNAHGATASSPLSVTETSGGLTPGATPMGSVSLAKGTVTYALANYFTDPSGIGLVYALIANPRGSAALDPARGLLVVRGTLLGATYTVTVSGVNRYGTVTSSLVVTEASEGMAPGAGTAPEATTMGAVTVSGTNTVSYALASYFTGGDVTYELVANPKGSGYISGGVLYVVGAFRDAAYTVTVRGSNDGGTGLSSLVVTEPSGAPTVAQGLGGLTLSSNTVTLPLADVFADPSGAGLAYGLAANPHGNARVIGDSLVMSGALRGASYAVTVTATNAYGYAVSTLSVTETAFVAPSTTSNLGPVSLSNAVVAVSLGDYFDGSLLEYRLAANPRGNVALTNGVMTVAGAWRGESYDVEVRAHNSAGFAALVFTVTEAWLAPYVKAELGAASLTNNTVNYALLNYFGGTTPLSYSLVANPFSNAAITSGTLSLVGARRGTTYSVVVGASNAAGLATSSLGVTESSPPPALYSFTTFTFGNAGYTGRGPPGLNQVVSAYKAADPTAAWVTNTAYLNMAQAPLAQQGYQAWTVPATGAYRITCAGAKGGNSSQAGGAGGIITASFDLNSGDKLIIIVGQIGVQQVGAGGGGASMVINAADTTYPMLLAAGGGGGGSSNPGTSPNTVQTGAATSGYGGGSLTYSGAAGYSANKVSTAANPAQSVLYSNGVGGANGTGGAGGGFPCAGGGGQSAYQGGGGGGYTGGSGGGSSTLAGSAGTMYSAASTYTFSSGVTNNGNGYVTVTLL